MSYTHFTFLVHVRLSSLSTPYRYDIIPETAHALFQMLPGILPLLPRAGIGIVLLTTFSSPSTSRGDKDEKFFNPDGGLNAYAQGVILAFVSVVGFRCFSSRPSSSGCRPLDPPEHSLPDLPAKLKLLRPQPNEPRNHQDLREILQLQDHPKRHGMKLKLLLGGIHGDQGCEHDYKMPMSYA
jgi:hypothetical protein